MMTPEVRYQSDAQFRILVDLLTHQIIQCNYSPSEIRDAAMLAVIHYEREYARPTFLMEGDSMRRVDGYHGKDSER